MREIGKKYGFILAVLIFSVIYFSPTAFAADATLTWSANTESDLAGYKIYYGTASRKYGPAINVGKATTYLLTGLANQTYYFALTAYDTAGNESGYSVEVSKTFTTPDTTAPLISSINASNITNSSVIITFGTNEPADTQVQYGTTSSYGSSSPLAAALVTVHSQALSALQPSTLYHYRVLSKDASGNLATSLDNTFTTAAATTPPPSSTPATVMLNPTADTFLNLDSVVNSSAATLSTYTWPANKAANAVLMKFALSAIPAGAVIQSATLNLSLVQADATTDPTYTVTIHKVINKNPDLTKATGMTYDGVNGWTANTCCANNVPLAQKDISAAYDTELIDKTLGVKSWDITKMVQEWMSSPSSNFGLLLNSDVTKGSDRYRTFASMENANAALRPSLSITYVSADTAVPVISNIAAGSLSSSGAKITWTTNEASTSQVEYGTTTTYGALSALDATLVTSHSTTLTGLNPSTLYHYRVKSKDAAGNLATSADGTFTTAAPPDTTPPTLSVISAGAITSSSASVSWTTNEAATTQIQYGTTLSYGLSTPLVSTLVTAHSQSLSALSPGTLYHYRVLSQDAAGNLATSADNTFTTAAAPDTSAPTVPQGLAATVLSAVQINLAWSASTDNVGVAGYRIYRNGIQIGTTTTPSYLDAGLLAATLYGYSVAAYDAAGNISAQSAVVSATTLPLGGSTKVTLNPTADTFLNVDNIVNSGAATLNTYTWPANKAANAVLMKFALSAIPAGAVIQSATLNLSLVQADATTDPTYTVTIHKVINKNPDLTKATGMTYDGVNGWTANTCCANNVPLAQKDISAAYDTELIDKTLGVKSWDITKMVQEWMSSPSSNFGLLLNSDVTKGSDRYRTFASMENANAALRPSLTITYSLP